MNSANCWLKEACGVKLCNENLLSVLPYHQENFPICLSRKFPLLIVKTFFKEYKQLFSQQLNSYKHNKKLLAQPLL